MSVSALQSLELIERLHAYDGVASPKMEEQRMEWVGTSLGIAGVPLLVGEGALEEIVETPAVTSIPGTKPWVIGVAAYKGGLLPIFSVDVLFRNRPYTGRVRDYCMVIRRPGMYFGVTLSHVRRDQRFPIEERLMDEPVDPDFARYTLRGFRSRGEFLANLDIDKMVADPEIADASATGDSSSKGKNDD